MYVKAEADRAGKAQHECDCSVLTSSVFYPATVHYSQQDFDTTRLVAHDHSVQLKVCFCRLCHEHRNSELEENLITTKLLCNAFLVFHGRHCE